MISRDAIIFVICLALATALTLVGTYYVVNRISPPVTQTMSGNR
jgi:hypothetical protein